MKLPAFTPKSKWTLPNISELPRWSEAKRVCVDLETRDKSLTSLGPGWRRDAYIVGVAFAIEDGPAFYLPIAHGNGTNLDRDKVIEYLRDQSQQFTGQIVGANLPYDLDGLANQNIIFRKAKFFRDVQVAEPILDELQMSYSLDNIARRRGMLGKDETHLVQAAKSWGVDPKSGLWELPPEHVGVYAEQDVRLPLAILQRQEREITDQELWGVYDLESRLLPVLLKMRRRGVAVDFRRLEEVEEWSVTRETSALARLTHLTGRHLNLDDTNKASVWAPILEGIGLTLPMTAPTAKFPQGQKSIKNAWLRSLPKHDVITGILDAKKFNKLRNTFVKSIRTHAVNGRIHCTFKQMVGEDDSGEEGGARYGRLSCTDPNLQQQPARDPEIGPEWRRIYIPDDDGQWATLDFSQQEPRWLTHYAELLRLPKAHQMAERYRNDPSADNHDMMATLINPAWPTLDPKAKKKERDAAKVIFLGLSYGMGPAKLSHSLGLPTAMRQFTNREGRIVEYLGAGDEAQELLDRFRVGVPFVKALMKKVQEKAGKRGYIVTADGRRCRFPRLPRPNKDGELYDWAHKGGNRLVQGSAGGQTKKAMVDADDAGIRLQLQVHDELDLTIWSPEEALTCAEIMRNALPCNVPHRVDIEVGPNWGDVSKPEWAS